VVFLYNLPVQQLRLPAQIKEQLGKPPPKTREMEVFLRQKTERKPVGVTD
jgi:hypothetical protein